MDLDAVARDVAASAHALESSPGFPAGYVEQARVAAAALAPLDTADGDGVGPAARDLALAAARPVAPAEAPALRRSGRRAVRKLVGWYLDVLVPPVARLGEAAARLGPLVDERLARIEARHGSAHEALRSELRALSGRVGGLEDRLRGKRPEQAGGPPAGS